MAVAGSCLALEVSAACPVLAGRTVDPAFLVSAMACTRVVVDRSDLTQASSLLFVRWRLARETACWNLQSPLAGRLTRLLAPQSLVHPSAESDEVPMPEARQSVQPRVPSLDTRWARR